MNIKIIEDNRNKDYITRDFREFLLQFEALTFLKRGKAITDEEYFKIRNTIKYEKK